jgi:hypothetical protein
VKAGAATGIFINLAGSSARDGKAVVIARAQAAICKR